MDAKTTLAARSLTLFACCCLLATTPASAQTGMTLSYEDEPYGTYDDPDNLNGESIEDLDVYIPSDPGPRPVLVEVHGGGWGKGEKSVFSSYHQNASGMGIIEKAYAEGWAVVSVNYPLVALLDDEDFPENTWPTGFNSVRRAIQFVRDMAATTPGWRLDPERMVGIGGSAGGHLLCCTAFMADGADPASLDPVATRSTRLSAVIAGWTPTSVAKFHLFATEYRPAQWELFGVTNADDFDDIDVCLTWPASPVFLATHDAVTLEPSPALAAKNAAIPVRGLYATTTADCSDEFTWPTDEAHGYAFGVLLQDAFHLSYCSDPCAAGCQDTAPTVDCESTPAPEWEDFGFLELPPTSPSQQQIDDFTDDVVEFLEPLALHTLVSVAPESGPMAEPFTISWHVNLGPTLAGAFTANAISTPSENALLLTLGANGLPDLVLDYVKLLDPDGDPVHELWAENIEITSGRNTLDFTLVGEVDFEDLAGLGITQVTAGIDVDKAGVPHAAADATWEAPGA